jgi:hypothetical protein
MKAPIAQFGALPGSFMVKKVLKKLWFGTFVWMIWRGRLKSKAAKYDSEDRVWEKKSALSTYKGHQVLSYTRFFVF